MHVPDKRVYQTGSASTDLKIGHYRKPEDPFGRKLSGGWGAGLKGMAVSGNLIGAFVVIPSEVIWSYGVGGVVFVIGLAAIFLGGDWQKARGLEKLVLFGPIFYAAPLAAFGTEHFTLVTAIASIVPKWMPWHLFWAYFVGVCFIAAGFSMVTRIQTCLAASLVALTFLLFVVLMDIPGWLRNPGDRFGITLVLRELAFSGGALALAASLSTSRSKIEATIARYFIAIPVLFYSFEQFLHADHVPGVPLEPLTPVYIPAHAFLSYLPAVVYAIGGVLLFVGKKTRAAATWVGASVLLVELVVYVPFAVVNRGSIEGLNFLFDTLMFCGAVLLLAGAMPPEGKNAPI